MFDMPASVLALIASDPSLLEQQVCLTRLALLREKEILSLALPPADDQSVGAQCQRELLLSAAETALSNARKAKEQLARTGGMTTPSEVLREIAAFGTVH
jgi:hypothetical protein